MREESVWGRAYRFLASKELAAALLLALCLVLIPGTLSKSDAVSAGLLPRLFLGCLALNLVFCTVRRARSFSRAVLVIHIGSVATLVGIVVSSSFSSVSTVNVYEGTSVDTAYRWDVRREMPLGFDLAVRKIHLDYYPVPVKVGVLRGAEKVALFELKTGGSFRLDRYTVSADSIEFPAENLHLSVFDGGRLVGSADTEGGNNVPADFPYEFRLVAFKNPAVKRAWVDMAISKDAQTVAEGTSEVNSPLTWEKRNFYNILVESDRYGMPYAGIQITHDPGKPFVYWGFAVVGLGCGMYFVRKMHGYR